MSRLVPASENELIMERGMLISSRLYGDYSYIFRITNIGELDAKTGKFLITAAAACAQHSMVSARDLRGGDEESDEDDDDDDESEDEDHLEHVMDVCGEARGGGVYGAEDSAEDVDSNDDSDDDDQPDIIQLWNSDYWLEDERVCHHCVPITTAGRCDFCNRLFDWKTVKGLDTSKLYLRPYMGFRANGRMFKAMVICIECEEEFPQAKTRWRFLRAWMRMRSIAYFWMHLVHDPVKYP
eukprot:1447279-Pleurochrysis_carterae.AAC.1